MQSHHHLTVDRSVFEKIHQARGLSNAWYCDTQAFERERTAVFARQWAGIGFGSDVAQAGALYPVNFMGWPLLMVRTKAGQVRVFHNVCRHRGRILVDAPCQSNGMIRCPYHSWVYSLEGALKKTPYVGGPDQDTHPDFEPELSGLLEVPSTEFMGVVMVNLDGQAEPFDAYAQRVHERWAPFTTQPLYPHGEVLNYDLQTNWKLAVENYCEAYHLPWVHPGLNSYSRLEDHYNIDEPGFSGQGSTVFAPVMDADNRRFPVLEGLAAEWDQCAEYIALFPNVLLGVHKDHTFALLVLPQSHERTLERGMIFYFHEEALGPSYEAMRKKHYDSWDSVFMEDVEAVEGMQRGRASPGFDGGHFSPVMDGPTHGFHKWVGGHLVRQEEGVQERGVQERGAHG